MAFVTRAEIEGRSAGGKIRLDQDVEVLAGVMKRGSILEFVADDGRELRYRDTESGEEISFPPSWVRHTPVTEV